MRQQRRIEQRKRQLLWALGISLLLVTIAVSYWLIHTMRTGTDSSTSSPDNQVSLSTSSQETTTASQSSKITLTASGDMLYHRPVYMSAFDGKRYDFDNDFEQVQPLIASADIAFGDFEGTINPNKELGGYPTFNAPPNVVESIKAAGFDVIDLAHNHILDTGIEGLKTTANAFQEIGLEPIGVNVNDQGIFVKEANGIKVAMLAYAYGFNGNEASLAPEEYTTYLKDLSMEKVAAEIKEAEKVADITVVMPQLGVEYSLEPTEEQQKIYRQMIDLGADIIFGGHPHVAEPTEIIEKDGKKNLFSIQWEICYPINATKQSTTIGPSEGSFQKSSSQKKVIVHFLSDIKLHPTWVSKEPIPDRRYDDPEFGTTEAYDFQVVLAEEYLPGEVCG